MGARKGRLHFSVLSEGTVLWFDLKSVLMHVVGLWCLVVK